MGLNFIDTYFRTGLYPARLPSGMGMEAAGVIEAVGEGVTAFKPGDRAGLHRIARRLCHGAADQGGGTAAGAGQRGQPDRRRRAAEGHHGRNAGRTLRARGRAAGRLVPAAAGGVGLLLVQWLKARGVRVIGTVGSPEKGRRRQGGRGRACAADRRCRSGREGPRNH